MPPLRCAPYYRVSRKDKERGISIDVQRDTCEPYAATRGWLLLEPYIDDGRSAFTDNLAKRPAFQRLLIDAKAHRFDVVLVYLYDRFGRKMRSMLQCIEDLKHCGVQVVSVTQADDWLTIGINALMAEQYSRLLSKRMKDVRRWEVQQGRHVGPIPVGYDRRGGILFPSSQADAIRDAGQLYATGIYGIPAITQALNASGYTMPNGSPFINTGVEEMLKNPTYAGFVQCGDLLLPGKHEALWNATTWQRIQEVAQVRARRRTKPTMKHNPLLAGMISCACCGAPMWHHASGPRRYYECSTGRNGRPSPFVDLTCTRDQVRAETVEMITLALVAGLGLTPNLIDEVHQMLQHNLQRGTLAPADIELRLKRLARAYADGGLSETEYEQRRTSLLAQLEAQPEPEAIRVEAVLALVKDLPTLLYEAPNAERRAVLSELVSQVYARRSEVLAFRPTRLALPLFQAAIQRGDDWLKSASWWAGRGSNPRPSA